MLAKMLHWRYCEIVFNSNNNKSWPKLILQLKDTVTNPNIIFFVKIQPPSPSIGKLRQLNETEQYEAVWDLCFLWDDMDFEILIQATFNEWDRDFLNLA